MSAAKIRALKIEVQKAAVAAARKFRELDREMGGRRCGMCEPCQEFLTNLAQLFSNAMQREMATLSAEAMEVDSSVELQEIEGFIHKDRLN
jgi:hypothetical protein